MTDAGATSNKDRPAGALPAARLARARVPAAVALAAAGGALLSQAAGQPAPAVRDPAAAMARLIAAYPAFLDRVEGNALVWKDGTRMPIDDGKGAKDHETLLAKADLKDMFHQAYVPGRPATSPVRNEDPGRARNTAFFDKMYGDCTAGGVARRLVHVTWLAAKWGKRLEVTPVNGVAERLAAVSAELDRLPARFDPYLFPSAGTYVCRPIAGTSRVSAHGHGIAIDISTRHSHYWRWAGGGKPGPGAEIPYRNSIPFEIVEVFERHGFIWGGKWYHYDTMHFEYRPELLPPL